MNDNVDFLIDIMKKILKQYYKLTDSEKLSFAKGLIDNETEKLIEEIHSKLKFLRFINVKNVDKGIDINNLYEKVFIFFKEHKDYRFNYISPVFKFPMSPLKEYINFVEIKIADKKRRWVYGGLEGKGIYNLILRNELISVDPQMPAEINKRCNGVYVIADEKGKVIYIGKREAKDKQHVISRFLDHLVPPKSIQYPYGQPSNKDGFIWDYMKYLSETKEDLKLQCFICFGLNFDSSILENYLIKIKNKNALVKTRY